MVNLTIDGKQITVKENSTIMEAAAQNGIPIPHLCYLKGINEIAACRVCVVELEGKERLITSCNNVAKEGMVIYTNSPKVRRHRKTNVELILSQHNCECVTCPRSGNCMLQTVANDLNILEIPYRMQLEKQMWNKEFPLIRDSSKCIKCMRCIQVCDKVQSLHIWDVEGTGSRTTVNVSGHKTIEESACSLCGQCVTHCPVGALRERNDTEKVWEALSDPNKIVVTQVAPAVRTAWGEEFGLQPNEATVGMILDALKKMGADYVFDTCFSADLTIMEEATEFIQRFTSGELKDRPMQEGTGAGVIFGTTGGVMEAALRSAYFFLKGENAAADAFQAVRAEGFNANHGVQEAEFQIDDITVRTAVVSGLGNTRALMKKIERGEVHYDFVEVMACPGGCVGGGGQPIHDGEERAFERGKRLYQLDADAKIRYSHDNPDIKRLYEEYFGEPNEHKAHMLLHTDHLESMERYGTGYRNYREE